MSEYQLPKIFNSNHRIELSAIELGACFFKVRMGPWPGSSVGWSVVLMWQGLEFDPHYVSFSPFLCQSKISIIKILKRKNWVWTPSSPCFSDYQLVIRFIKSMCAPTFCHLDYLEINPRNNDLILNFSNMDLWSTWTFSFLF